MRKLTLAFLALAMLGLIVPSVAMADTVVDLIAGQHYDVGDVTVSSDADNIYVRFDITRFGYFLYKTQVDVNLDYNNIPQKNGNTIPGKFAYKKSLDFATSWTQVIPIKDEWRGAMVYIAAHADVGGLGKTVESICANLPAQVTEEVWPGTESYMIKTLTEAGPLNGVWAGWCLNPFIQVTEGWKGEAAVYCSYADPLTLPALFGDVSYLDSVNWLLNNSEGIDMPIVQAAIWMLLHGDNPDLAPHIVKLGVDPADPALAAIVAEAKLHDGFKPMKGQYVVVLLAPEGVQPNLILVKIVGDETAWGKGTDFYGSDWSMWFTYDVPALP